MDSERESLTTYEELAKRIDHSMVRPELTSSQVNEGCRTARDYGVACVIVRPSDVELAVGLMDGSGIGVGSIAGFPHGSQTTPVKLYEARDLLRRGAKEIDMVLNIGQMLSRQFQHVEAELAQMAQACHEESAILKVILENAYLTDDLKVIACKIAKRTGVDFVKTATGFAASGYTLEDVRLMHRCCAPRVGIKAAGGVRTLDQALEVYQAGCERIGTSATANILDEWRHRIEERKSAATRSTES